MDGDVLVAAFRLGTQRLGPWGHGTRYPAALREKAVEYLRARRGTGVPVSMIASELGVGSGTLLRWASEPASSGPTFVPVKMVGSQTLWDQIERLARVLGSLKEAIHAYVLAQAVIGADETRWHLLDGQGRDTGEARQWQVSAVASPDAVAYSIEGSRSTEAAKKALRGFRGVAMADGYGVYQSLAGEPGGFILANCWAHVRRKVTEAEISFPAQAKEGLDLIGELYAVERLCPTGPPGDELRRRMRDERSRSIVKRIQTWAFSAKAGALPQSGLGKAIDYMLGMWPGLVRFLDDPRIPIDNNGTERGIRGVVVGRKNHYGSKSRRGREVAALFYAIVESAKLGGVEPKAYLRLATYAALRGEPVPLPHEVAHDQPVVTRLG